MIAIGISAWSAVKTISEKPQTAQNSSASSLNYTSSNEISVDAEKSDIKKSSSNSDNSAYKQSDTDKSSSADTKSETQAAAAVAKYFIYPINGEVIKDFNSSELQYSLTYNDMRLHTGMDIKADANTAVQSCGDGVVLSAGKDSLLGYTVKINHGNGITGVYSGLKEKITVKKGDTVKAGTNIGALGTVPSECVDAPHLHLEFYKDKTPIAPSSLLKKDSN